ncbi:MAG: DUF488 domain-containing protein [Candidatus Micrarchaeota archaeon]|nr:DUF488 domain-containing protein [Candidatus Micrarchaeota archaeon]MDE1847916.1 DUF488 domain-containing protein [Candidatus Micrarchaeota archaeon]MDE1864966.1 DUF488 domain-containing protein [Candidatus Micrarchaeota archaeon]
MLLGIKRIYNKPDITDGQRVLVDRLWPRGVKKSTSNIDEWFKEVAPSNELRKWFSHDPEKWKEFKKKYRKEIEGTKAFIELVELIKASDVTFLYAAKDTEHNNAAALAEMVKEKLGQSTQP